MIRAMNVLEKLEKETQVEDEKIGVKILKKALAQPLWWIAQNSGAKADAVLETVRKGTGDYGFDAMTEEYGPLVAKGIIDPLKVTRLALQNAASIGTMILTTEGLICDLPEKEKTPGMPAGGMGGMGDY